MVAFTIKKLLFNTTTTDKAKRVNENDFFFLEERLFDGQLITRKLVSDMGSGLQVIEEICEPVPVH